MILINSKYQFWSCHKRQILPLRPLPFSTSLWSQCNFPSRSTQNQHIAHIHPTTLTSQLSRHVCISIFPIKYFKNSSPGQKGSIYMFWSCQFNHVSLHYTNIEYTLHLFHFLLFRGSKANIDDRKLMVSHNSFQTTEFILIILVDLTQRTQSSSFHMSHRVMHINYLPWKSSFFWNGT